MNKSKLLILKTLTPVHVGASEGNSFVDLPIQREATTNIPKIDSSSFKGALNMKTEEIYGKKFQKLFGTNNKKYGGTLSFTDLKVLFFPIKSSQNIFSYVTCPYILNRFLEELILFQTQDQIKEDVKEILNKMTILTENDVYSLNEANSKIYLDKYSFNVKSLNCKSSLFNEFKNLKEIKNNILIISDLNFIDFSMYYTEIMTRNRIDNSTNTTKFGSLFTEEYIPMDTIMYNNITHFDEFQQLNNSKDTEYEQYFKRLTCNSQIKNRLEYIKIGSNANLGKGLMQIII